MPTFVNFSDILPDPIYKITGSGNQDFSGSSGPGFASLGFTSTVDKQVSRTNSGRGVIRENESQFYSINIQYNPMLRDEFEVVEAFLAARKTPFYVVLPQYSKPKDVPFAVFAASTVISIPVSYNPGSSFMTIQSSSVISGNPKFGDKFTITDVADANHQKVYSITRVETNDLYQIGKPQPTTSQKRIWFDPPLQRFTTAGAIVNFTAPKFRVYQVGNTREYNLDDNGLYSFGLSLEEIQP